VRGEVGRVLWLRWVLVHALLGLLSATLCSGAVALLGWPWQALGLGISISVGQYALGRRVGSWLGVTPGCVPCANGAPPEGNL
jgi:hypothetical protein